MGFPILSVFFGCILKSAKRALASLLKLKDLDSIFLQVFVAVPRSRGWPLVDQTVPTRLLEVTALETDGERALSN